eukprot:CAMPEP_0195007976 /NCGR_PEP_ID=MMETSP0326_2-20130528/8074_1 /TAXON_ID=2866 ORGANISM="Crypthecodinium cohnii, Strain Seligo" /NCGR_SAMPLE_ID=MMETSP0326_2 /ASSEMBLY_ACC=CAM_ASM_000348 /LENGTH=124 /DNA_ID=CAMNT_0040015589 /DNA_START=166 /DNA_END=538 /DNA_ORIENTATION=-
MRQALALSKENDKKEKNARSAGQCRMYIALTCWRKQSGVQQLSTFFLAAGGFGLDNFFLTACSLHDDKDVSALLDALEDLGGDFFVVFGGFADFDNSWQIEIILGLTGLGQQAPLASVPIGSQE